MALNESLFYSSSFGTNWTEEHLSWCKWGFAVYGQQALGLVFKCSKNG